MLQSDDLIGHSYTVEVFSALWIFIAKHYYRSLIVNCHRIVRVCSVKVKVLKVLITYLARALYPCCLGAFCLADDEALGAVL